MITKKWLVGSLIAIGLGLLSPSQSQACWGLFSGCFGGHSRCAPSFCGPMYHCQPCMPMHCGPQPMCYPVYYGAPQWTPMHHPHPKHPDGKKDELPKPKEKKHEEKKTINREEALRGQSFADHDQLFSKGFSAYFDGDTQQAVEYFAAALTLNDKDARAWYFMSLAQRTLGHTAIATEAANIGAAYELTEKVSKAEMGRLMERVQGEPRQFLTSAKEATASDDIARRVLAGQKEFVAKHIRSNSATVATK